MARIPSIPREQVPPQYQAFFDERKNPTTGAVGGPYRVLMHVPSVAQPWRAWIEDALRKPISIPPSLYEIAILVTAREERCPYVWTAHQRGAPQAKVRPEALAVLRGEAPARTLTTDEALIVSYTEQVLRDRKVSDAVFSQMKQRWGEEAQIRLTALIGAYRLLATLLAAYEVMPEDEGEPSTFPG